MRLDFKKLEIKKIQATDFIMSPLELKDYISFEPKRIYCISKPTGNTGQHCHLKEEELFIMAAGSCTMIIDRGNGKEDIKLKSPTDAVYVGPYVWHGFKDMSADAIIVAVSSTNYSPDRHDYIEDYDQYKDIISTL